MIQALIFGVALVVLCNQGVVGNLPAPEDFRSTLEMPEPGYTEQDRADMDMIFEEVE